MLQVKRGLFIFFVFFLITVMPTKALAAELSLPKVAINPDKYLLYSGKRLLEKAIIFTKFSEESKMDYYKELSLTRLAELKYVAEEKLLGEVERSTQRLSYEIGTLSDYIKANPKLEKNKKSIDELLISYKNLLGNLRDIYPANSPYWLLIQHSINSIDLNVEKLR